MSKPIENCPQPDEPIRERAYTDRQLLELAAKAAALPLSTEWDAATDGILIGYGDGDLEPWNPLTGDGDALRLAASLSLDISHGPKVVQVSMRKNYVAELCGGNRLAATRRAIVRAAATIAEGAKS